MITPEFIFSAVKRLDIEDLLAVCKFPFKDLTWKIIAIATIQAELPEEAKKRGISLSFYDDKFHGWVTAVASMFDMIDAAPMINAAFRLAMLGRKPGVFAIQDFLWRHKEDALSLLGRGEVPAVFKEVAYVLFPFLAPAGNQTVTFAHESGTILKQEDYVREVYGATATEIVEK